MDHQVETHEVLERLVIVAHHGAVVTGVVEGQVLCHLPVLELAAVDQRRHLGHLGNHVKHILVRVLPVLLFVWRLAVLLMDFVVRLKVPSAGTHNTHRVHIDGWLVGWFVGCTTSARGG